MTTTKKSPGLARSIKLRLGQEAYEKYKETGIIPAEYADTKPPSQRVPYPNMEKYTDATAVAAQRKLDFLGTLLERGSSPVLIKEKAVECRAMAQECLDNCDQYFGEWEQAYHHAMSILDKLDLHKPQIDALTMPPR
jgi:hypothetical protein